MDTNRIEDPEIREWKRLRALTGMAVLCSLLAGIAVVGATAPSDPTQLAVNCTAIGIEGFPYDDSGTHAALCAGQATPRRAKPAEVADGRMPPPDAQAVAEPLPPTF